MTKWKTPAVASALLACVLVGAQAAQVKSPASGKTAKSPAPASKAKPAPAGGAQKAKPAPAGYSTDREKLSYVVGFSVGSTLKRDLQKPEDISVEVLVQGLKAALAGAAPVVSNEDAQRVLNQFQQAITARQEELAREAAGKRQVTADKNLQDGKSFLDANGKKEDVVVLPSGLQYRVVATGTGNTPKPSDTVTVNYRGTLTDGTEFDSSYKRGEPATFPVNGVIKGWTEALSLMQAGSKWQLFIPSDLAYGEQGAGPVIGPNSVLVFDVELLSVAAAPEPAGDGPAGPEPAGK